MKITKVELWLNECYGCKASRYTPLHDWYLSLGMPLGNFEAIRVPLKREWQDFAKKMKETAHIDLPFVVIRVDDKDTEAFIYGYDNFIKQIEGSKGMFITMEQQNKIARDILVKEEEKKDTETVELTKKPTKKQGIVKKNKTKTTEVK